MEQSTIIQEIKKALEMHSEQMNKRIDGMENRMSKRMDEMETRFDKLETRMDNRFDQLDVKMRSTRIELSETQETVDFLTSKNAQHEKKLRNVSNQ